MIRLLGNLIKLSSRFGFKLHPHLCYSRRDIFHLLTIYCTYLFYTRCSHLRQAYDSAAFIACILLARESDRFRD